MRSITKTNKYESYKSKLSLKYQHLACCGMTHVLLLLATHHVDKENNLLVVRFEPL